MKTDSVVFREDLYPRIETSPTTVQKYAEDLSVLPPIEVNQHGELIDGWHRWTAHKKNGAEEVPAIVTQTTSDAHLLELAIERNAKHGLQLSQSDKRDMAVKIYGSTPTSDRDEKKKQLAKILSVSVHTVRKWTTDIDRQAKEDRNRRILKLWMECWSLDEIGKACGCDKSQVTRICCEMADLSKCNKPHRLAATYEDDFEPQRLRPGWPARMRQRRPPTPSPWLVRRVTMAAVTKSLPICRPSGNSWRCCALTS